MPVQKCTKDGKSGYKWGEQGVCFLGDNAKEKAAEVGRAINAQNDGNLSFEAHELTENTSKRVQVAKIGTFDHDVYGKFSITLSDLKKMKVNFDDNIRKQKMDGRPVLPFDYSHFDGDKAAGWIVELTIQKNSLFAEVDWTPLAAEKIRGNEFKFVSPSIHRNYKDSETGKTFDVVLMGAALTNVPFLRDMEAVHLLSESRKQAFLSLKLSGDASDLIENEGEEMPNIEELIAFLPSMSPEDKKQLFERLGEMLERNLGGHDDEELSEKLKTAETALKGETKKLNLSEKELKNLKEKMSGSDKLEDRLKLSDGKVTKLTSDLLSITKTLAESTKKSEFDTMLSEGKVCEAQRKPFMEGNIAEFAKNAQEYKLDEAGSSGTKGTTEDEAAGKIIKLAEKKEKEDKIPFGDALSMVLSDNKELADKAGY